MSLSKQFIQNRLAYLKTYFADFNSLKVIKGAKLKPLKLKVAGVLKENSYNKKGFRGAELVSKYTKRYANTMVDIGTFSPMEYVMSSMELGVILTGDFDVMVDTLKIATPVDAEDTSRRIENKVGKIPEGYRGVSWEQFQRTFVLYRRSTALDGVDAEVDDPKIKQAIKKFLMSDHLKIFMIPFNVRK